ncbi:hypothetical protein HF526_02960 [Pseudonocardia sp. K10HN5]|uniref:SLATT domain-containing protein n=1 Tax=Pseudonocardia acidicola TaxID=2724939 RepID=A0ABX1S748_9PSEU|nr:hypothetical protein [Pseudonocardia acidicola]
MVDDEAEARQQLLARIGARRAGITAFLARARPRGARLANTSVVASALAAIFTAGPAAGGEKFAEAVQDGLRLGSDSTVWRLLCLAALIVSVVAAVTTNLAKSQDMGARIVAAEAANAELEGLQTTLQFGHLPLDEAVKRYQQYVAKVPFVEEQTVPV